MVYDIIVIGAGTAGMTAGIYARRAEKSVLIFEGASFGGQIINAANVKNYPAECGISGADFAAKIYNQVTELGAEFKFEKVTNLTKTAKLFKVKTKSGEYLAKTVIIATGSKNRMLGIDGETKFIGRGVSYCATCDGMFFKGKKVAIVGAGSTAFEDALYLSNISKEVFLLLGNGQIKAEESVVRQVKSKPNIKIIYATAKEIVGESKVEKIRVEESDKKMTELEVDGVFVAIGRVPDNLMFAKIVEMDKFGYIVSDESCTTKTEGLFVAGDCRTKAIRQLVTATADGATAALMANKFLMKK